MLSLLILWYFGLPIMEKSNEYALNTKDKTWYTWYIIHAWYILLLVNTYMNVGSCWKALKYHLNALIVTS